MNKRGDYSKLLELLVRDFSWPHEYMFKFVVPFNASSLDPLKNLFGANAKISHRESKSSKYISFTAIQLMDNPDDVINIYKEAEKIENIIAI